MPIHQSHIANRPSQNSQIESAVTPKIVTITGRERRQIVPE